MIYRILVLGASYGSLFATKCLMADHDVTLVCRTATAELINADGTEVRLALKGEAPPRHPLGRPSRPPRRHHAGADRALRLRSCRAGDAGAAIRAP